MSHTTTPPRSGDTTTTTGRTLARWMVSFTGFPLGGLAAMTVVGPVDSTAAALTGGLLTGAILGAVQGWALRMRGTTLLAWAVATAVGLAIGLALGAGVVDFGTQTADLALQGAVSGAIVGLAQAVLLRRRVGTLALAWPAYLAVAWTLGWLVTTGIGVAVEDRFTVFGSSGAVVVTLLTAVLPLTIARREAVR